MTCVFSCTNIPWYSKNQRVLYAENLNNNKFFKMHFNWFYPFKWRCICRYIHICTGVDKWNVTPCWGYKWKVRSREGVVKVVGVPGGRPKFKGKTWILRGVTIKSTGNPGGVNSKKINILNMWVQFSRSVGKYTNLHFVVSSWKPEVVYKLTSILQLTYATRVLRESLILFIYKCLFKIATSILVKISELLLFSVLSSLWNTPKRSLWN